MFLIKTACDVFSSASCFYFLINMECRVRKLFEKRDGNCFSINKIKLHIYKVTIELLHE